MFYRAGRCPVRILVLLGGPVLHHLLAGLGVLAVSETAELFGADCPREAHLGRELALPLARNRAVLLVVALGAGSELHPVIGLCLA